MRHRARAMIATVVVALAAIAGVADADELAEQYAEAEALWKRAETEKDPGRAAALWEEAAAAYTAVAREAPEGHALRKEAAYAAVLSWKNALAAGPVAAPRRSGASANQTRQPIPAREQKMIEAFDLYFDVVADPDDGERIMMQFLKARIYWRHGHLDDAVPLLEEITADHLEHETGEWAVNLLLDSLNREGKYDEMVALVDRLLPEKAYLADHEELAERLELVKVQSLRKDAEELERRGRYVACGEAYRAIYERDPKAERADELLYNAGVCLEVGHEVGRAVAAFDLVIERFPRSRLAQKATARTAQLLARVARYDQAAERLERYARRYAGERDARAAISDAVTYYRGAGAISEAIAATRWMIAAYARKHPAETAAAAYLLSDLYRRAGAPAKRAAQLERYLRDYASRGGIDRRILAHVELGELAWQRSCAHPDATGACLRVARARGAARCKLSPQGRVSVRPRNTARAAAARRHFEKAIALYRDGRALDDVPGRDVARAARQRRMTRAIQAARFFLLERDFETALATDPRDANAAAAREALEADYRAVAATDGGDSEYAVAALLRAGQLSRIARDALLTRRPRAADTCDRATALDEAAASTFGQCLALDAGLLARGASWATRCERELTALRPDAAPPLREHIGTPRATPVLSLEPPVSSSPE